MNKILLTILILWASAFNFLFAKPSNKSLTASVETKQATLDCAKTVYSLPNIRFMQKVKCSIPTAKITVSHLPKGLKWYEKRNIVVGKIRKEGIYTYQIKMNYAGHISTENVTLTVSKHLQLPTPFMGWLSWNSVEADVSEDIVKQTVKLFKDKGLYQCGWNYIMLDDWWHAKSRNADGTPRADNTRFPHGIAPIAAYVHSEGMKFGLYTDVAEHTCAGAFGSYNYETVDAKAYANWKVDIVKCDYCNAPTDKQTAKMRYKKLSDAIKAAGYGTTLYICEWGDRQPWKWGAEAGGRCWRVSHDVRDCWTGKPGGIGVVQSIRDMKKHAAYQGVNRFNDADMLCTGLHGTGKSSSDLCGGKGAGMTQDEYRTQFALWCMWSSPMALSFDPRSNTLTEDDYKILTNKDLIALNQDSMGQQADLISEDNNMIVFAKDCENGDVAISVTNMTDTTKSFTFDFSKIPALSIAKLYRVKDLWNSKLLPRKIKGQLPITVRSHATQVFRLSCTAK